MLGWHDYTGPLEWPPKKPPKHMQSHWWHCLEISQRALGRQTVHHSVKSRNQGFVITPQATSTGTLKISRTTMNCPHSNQERSLTLLLAPHLSQTLPAQSDGLSRLIVTWKWLLLLVLYYCNVFDLVWIVLLFSSSEKPQCSMMDNVGVLACT